ncbi:hypothetical protein OO014_11345 [Intrasporangium calvum]|uniref:Septum formation initiator n=1 Tax=Intrasporangium calvum TaxID=53358 RepID=A0ABT5GIR8_9MICO|nr:hypothetical protein [Intrasporangium calvum]MDC5697856.1 hypothetical protein [Intrasporangium calvum]
MSQATATARPLRSPGRSPRGAPAPATLRVIPARITTTGHGAFASICVVLMTTGLVALLLLNTALAHGSLELGALQRESAVLSETAGNLQEEIDRASASGALAKKASQLGLVRANERAYIDLTTGTVTGTAYPATSAQALSVVTSPTPVAKPKATTKPAAATPTGTPSPRASTSEATASATPTKPAATASGAPTATLGTSPTGEPTTPASDPVTTPTATR